MINRDYETLDAIVVISSLVMVTLLGAGLVLIQGIPTDRLPILSSLATAILGLPVAYGAFRWGNNVGAKAKAEAEAEATRVMAAAAATPAEGTATITAAPDVDVAIRQADTSDELPPDQRVQP